MRTILLFALAAFALVGCSNKPKADLAENGNPSANKPLTDEDRLIKAVEEGVDRAPGHYDFEGPGGKWDPSKASMLTVGREMDVRARGTKNALCSAIFTYDDPSVGKLTGNPQIRIQDKDHFEVEYMLPDTKSENNRVRGDGSKRAALLEAGWKDIKLSNSPSRSLTEKEVLEWPRRFPEEMLSHYIEGLDSWAPLFEAWSKGVGGYKAVFEEQKFTRGDKSAAHYRVFAETEKGGGTRIEVIVDKQHLRPLTIKVNGTLKDGREYDMYWTGSWFTGGKYDEGVFQIPTSTSQTAKAS